MTVKDFTYICKNLNTNTMKFSLTTIALILATTLSATPQTKSIALLPSVTPNPVQSTLHIENFGNNIATYNIHGQLVEHIQSHTSDIDVSSYASGQYIIKSDNGTSIFLKE